ncbi:hypothetical protein L1887_51438 [Cichorium endivia]|nr:hypothetical protein L1887_51438 [Cichorium endivia]
MPRHVTLSTTVPPPSPHQAAFLTSLTLDHRFAQRHRGSRHEIITTREHRVQNRIEWCADNNSGRTRVGGEGRSASTFEHHGSVSRAVTARGAIGSASASRACMSLLEQLAEHADDGVHLVGRDAAASGRNEPAVGCHGLARALLACTRDKRVDELAALLLHLTQLRLELGDRRLDVLALGQRVEALLCLVLRIACRRAIRLVGRRAGGESTGLEPRLQTCALDGLLALGPAALEVVACALVDAVLERELERVDALALVVDALGLVVQALGHLGAVLDLGLDLLEQAVRLGEFLVGRVDLRVVAVGEAVEEVAHERDGATGGALACLGRVERCGGQHRQAVGAELDACGTGARGRGSEALVLDDVVLCILALLVADLGIGAVLEQQPHEALGSCARGHGERRLALVVLEVEDVGELVAVVGETVDHGLHVVARGVRLASAEGEVDDVVEDGAVVAVDVEDGSMEEFKELGELAQVVVVGEHGGAHERGLLVGVHAEDVGAGREEELDDADAAHGARPVQGGVLVVVDAHVRVEVRRRVDEQRRHGGVLGDKVVEDDVGVPRLVGGLSAIVVSRCRLLCTVRAVGTIGGQGARCAGGGADVAGGGAHAALGGVVLGGADGLGFGLDAGGATGAAEGACVCGEHLFGAVGCGDGVLGSGWGRIGGGGDVGGDGGEERLDVVALCELDGDVEGDPCALRLSGTKEWRSDEASGQVGPVEQEADEGSKGGRRSSWMMQLAGTLAQEPWQQRAPAICALAPQPGTTGDVRGVNWLFGLEFS